MARKPSENPFFGIDKYEIADHAAIKALSAGQADPDQQRRALKFIVEVFAGYYDLSYCPNDRDTAFKEGRRFVGQQIVKLSRLPVARNTDG